MKINEFLAKCVAYNLALSGPGIKSVPLTEWIKANPGKNFSSHFSHHNNLDFILYAIRREGWIVYCYALIDQRNAIRVNISSSNTGSRTDRLWTIRFTSVGDTFTVSVLYKAEICVTDDFDTMIQAIIKHCEKLETHHKKLLDDKAKKDGNIPHMILQELRDLVVKLGRTHTLDVEYDPKSSSPYMRITNVRNGKLRSQYFETTILFKGLEATIKVRDSAVTMIEEVVNLADRGVDPEGFKKIIRLLSETLPALRKEYDNKVSKIKLSDLFKEGA
jgi:hypothetical protein